ncbi:MAG: hypothetical protein ACE5QV_09355, partial [Fidelibacterota bacterium]
EYFNIDPEYKTELAIYSFDRQYTTQTQVSEPDTGGVFYWLVDDNDDDDRYHDGFFEFKGTNKDRLDYTENPDEVFNPGNPLPDAGVFPGLDENNDGIPDDDQNSNGTPDYNEPFLMYYIDPPRFDYGDDWNNNGQIDVRENDRRPDYIYNRDLKGYHIFFVFNPARNLSFTTGRLRHSQIAGGGKNFINYLKLLYLMEIPRVGGMDLYFVTKRVQDNIPDPIYRFDFEKSDFSIPVFTDDNLLMTNSVVNTFYWGARYKQIKNFKTEISLKYDINNQKKTESQPKGKIIYWGLVFPKIEYAVKLSENVTFIPQFKIRTEKQTRNYRMEGEENEQIDFHRQWWIPILRFDYTITPRTSFRFGFQGFSLKDLWKKLNDREFFTFKYRDRKNPENDHNDKIFMAIVSNSTEYQGYTLWFNIGYEKRKESYLMESQKTRDKDFTRIFVQIVAGF